MNEKTELSAEQFDAIVKALPSTPWGIGSRKLDALNLARAVWSAASPSSKSTKEAGPFDSLPPEIEGRLSVWLTLGKELHPLTVHLVVRFARALAAKLADAERKYGYSDGWRSPDWMDECRAHLMEHIGKGDPRDVAAYCAFLWHHGESTALASSSIKEEGAAGVDASAEAQRQRAKSVKFKCQHNERARGVGGTDA